MFDLEINTTIAEHGPMMMIVACLVVGVGVSVMRLCRVWEWGVYTVCSVCVCLRVCACDI